MSADGVAVPAKRSGRRLAVGAAAFALAGPVASAGNLIFHVVASRALGPDSYGALNALLVLTLVVAVPAAAVQMSVARALLSGSVSAQQLRNGARRLAAWTAIGLGAIALPVAGVLHLDGPVPVIVLAGYLVAVVVGLVPKAVLVAEERFATLATATVLGVAFRLVLGALALAAGGGLVAAVAAGSVAEIASTAFLLRATRSSYTEDGASRPGWRGHVTPVLGLAGLWGFLAVDTIAARAGMSATVAGTYTAAAVLARAAMFLPQSVATVAFARLANPTTRARAMAWATATALTLAVAGVVGLAVGGGMMGQVLFGADFEIDRRLLTVLAATVAVMSVSNLWLHARIAYGQPVGLRILAALAVTAAGAAPAVKLGTHALASWMLVSAVVSLWLVRPRSAVALPFPDPTRLLGPQELEITVVIPAWNAAATIGPHLLDVHSELVNLGARFEIVVVDDGSTDETADVVASAELAGVRLLRVAHGGKGQALTAGMSEASGALIGFIDADGDIPAAVLTRLIEAVGHPGVDGAVAVKSGPATRGVLRQAASWGYRLVVRLVLAVDVSDTQTGAKVFRRDTVAAVLPWLSERGFAWDAEFLAAARRLGRRRFVEIPVSVKHSRTTIRPAAVWNMVSATVRVGGRVAMLPGFDHLDHTAVQPPSRPGRTSHPAVPMAALTRPAGQLRILVLSWKCIRHERVGGAEVFTHEVARRWARQGHAVTLFSSSVEGAPSTEIIDGYCVVRGGSRLSVYREARRYWLEHRDEFDVIVDEVNTRPFDAPLWADVVVVGLFHQLARDVWWHELPAPVAAAGRFVVEPAWIRTYRDVPVGTISDSSALSLRAAGLGRVVNLGCGVSLPSQLPCPAKSTVPTVAFVGRMVSAKRPLDVVHAFERARAELGEGRLLLMGDGPIGASVQCAARRVPGATYLGRVTEREKFEQLGEAHVLAVTSVREGWGLVVDEAAAMGVHPIGYRVPGLVDSVPAAGGTIVDPNPDALAEALVRRLPVLVSQPASPRQGGAKSWDEVADRFLALLATAARPTPVLVGGKIR